MVSFKALAAFLCATSSLTLAAEMLPSPTLDLIVQGVIGTLDGTATLQHLDTDSPASAGAFTPQNTVDWLDKWMSEKIPDAKGQDFFPALIKSFEPLFPTLGRGQDLNFECNILHPCQAGTSPPGESDDQRYAWSVLVGMQNLNQYYSFQYSLLEKASDTFMITYSDSFFNKLREDNQKLKHVAVLPTGYGLAKDLGKAAKEVFEAAWKNSMVSTIFKAVPALDLTLTVAHLLMGDPIKEAEKVPNAEMNLKFGEFLKKQMENLDKIFMGVMSADPRGPTGVLTRFQAEPAIWLSSPMRWSEGDVTAKVDQLVSTIGRAYIMTYFSTTGQQFIDITDPEWRDGECLGTGQFNYPLCIFNTVDKGIDLHIDDYNMDLDRIAEDRDVIAAFKPDYDTVESGWKRHESPIMRLLNSKPFTSSPFYINTLEVVSGSMKCQHERMKKGQFFSAAHSTSRMEREGGAPSQDYQLGLDMARNEIRDHPEWKTYNPTLDSEDECLWSVPIAADLKVAHKTNDDKGDGSIGWVWSRNQLWSDVVAIYRGLK